MRFGIIGTNWITDALISGGKLATDFELTAVYSRNEEQAKKFADKYGVKNIFTDLNAMAKSGTMDAVYIASPNSLHAPQSILFLQNKIAVLCEKPASSTVAELQKVITTAKENDTLYMEAMKTTFLPNYEAVKQNLDKIGPIRHILTTFCQYSSRYDAVKRGEVPNVFSTEFSGGSLMDIGVYPLYFLIATFGVPEKVESTAQLLSTGVDGQGTISMDYGSFKATVLHSKIFESALPTEIIGEDGTIRIYRVSLMEKVELLNRKNQSVADISVSTTDVANADMYYELQHFIDLFKAGKKESPVNSFDTSLNVMKTMEAIRKEQNIVFTADAE